MQTSATLKGVSATPVVERTFTRMVDQGRKVRRLCLLRADKVFVIWVQVADAADPVTIELFRGGVRSWATMTAAVRWIEDKMPELAAIEVVLQPV